MGTARDARPPYRVDLLPLHSLFFDFFRDRESDSGRFGGYRVGMGTDASWAARLWRGLAGAPYEVRIVSTLKPENRSSGIVSREARVIRRRCTLVLPALASAAGDDPPWPSCVGSSDHQKREKRQEKKKKKKGNEEKSRGHFSTRWAASRSDGGEKKARAPTMADEAKTAAAAPTRVAETKTEAAAKAPEAKGPVYPKLPPRMSKPDRRQFELARGEIESEIKKLTAERERLFEAVKIAENGGGEKKNKLRAEIREISSKAKRSAERKERARGEAEKFRDERDALREKSRKLRDSLGKFKTVEDIDRAIERMHHRGRAQAP